MSLAVEREELRHLVEELPDDQVVGILEDVRLRLRPVEPSRWPPRWFSFGPSNDGRSDTSVRVDEVLAEGFGL
jgi:hypothetical protein